MKGHAAFSALITMSLISYAQVTVTFPSSDGLAITADIYEVSHDAPVILLCHQARYSRGEYIKTAVKLNELGFNCIAIDQRSGNEVNGVRNETAAGAAQKNFGQDYLDAEIDIIAAVGYAYTRFGKLVILVGSSYSASLALKIAAVNDKILAVAAFSPGEYFGNSLQVRPLIASLDKPAFVTSSRDEAPQTKELLSDVHSSGLVHFVPDGEGIHGTRALWKTTINNEEYWQAFTSFLSQFLKPGR